jgi:hypothetical protein
MAATTTKRKTAARKPAAKRAAKATNGQAQNGQATNGQAALAPPVEFVPRDPEESIPLVAAVNLPAHPFGDRKVQLFTPTTEEGGEPFVIPHISTVPVTEEFLWENERRKLDMMHQSWRWMDLAEMPEETQRRVLKLPSVDKRRFWQEWFQGFTPPPASEPPGES